MKTNPKYLIAPTLMLVLLGIFLSLLLPGKEQEVSLSPQDTAEGLSYLHRLELQDPAEVETILKEQRRQARMELMERGELDVWDQLQDAVILGDSRAVGFWYFDWMPQERVLGDAGHRIDLIPDYYETLRTLNPAQVFLCYGVNDIGIGYWPEPALYAAAMDEAVRELQEVLPEAEIYVCATMRVKEPGLSLNSVWHDIPEYNAVMKAMCQEKGWNYVDVDDMLEEYSSLWDSDGIHLQKEFYPYWARRMALAIYDSKGE